MKLKTLFFSRIKKDLVGEPLNAINKIENKFYDNMEDFSLTKESFDPRKCYRYEGTK